MVVMGTLCVCMKESCGCVMGGGGGGSLTYGSTATSFLLSGAIPN